MLLILILCLLAVMVVPQWWIKRIMTRHHHPQQRYPGTGAELARHLLDRLGLEQVGVEITEAGDHYDPQARMVRLSPANHQSCSLTAITVAAHEVGHAVQHADGYRPLIWRTRMVQVTRGIQRLGVVLMALAPLALLTLRLPPAALLLAGLAALSSGVLIHMLTLPTEIDASFRRALPMLEKGGYLKSEDRRPARRILTAAAFTYVAASLGGLVNFWMWLRWLRP